MPNSLTPGEMPVRKPLMTPAERYEAEVVRITQFQNRVIRNVWDKESPDAE